MNWFFLVLAGLFEIGWPVGLKMVHLKRLGAVRI